VRYGRVILLNGTSSSGKTTIARALQNKLAEPYMLVSIDGFFQLYPERFLDPKNEAEMQIVAGLLPAVVSGMHGSVAALAGAGNNVIVDHVLQEEGWLRECVTGWAGLDVLFVGLRCPLDVLEKREENRGDRNPGTARYQFERVHAHELYDLELDTSLLNVEACVQRIAEMGAKRLEKPAFEELRKRYSEKR
jgi:chloramphenicol 3-O phosphotransferase